MKITVELEVTECMPIDKSTGLRSGHMHMCVASDAIISKAGEKLGSINVDPAMTLILTVNHEYFHISSLAIWEALYATRPKTN